MGFRLKEAREEAHMTQQELAEKSGVILFPFYITTFNKCVV